MASARSYSNRCAYTLSVVVTCNPPSSAALRSLHAATCTSTVVRPRRSRHEGRHLVRREKHVGVVYNAWRPTVGGALAGQLHVVGRVIAHQSVHHGLFQHRILKLPLTKVPTNPYSAAASTVSFRARR